MAASTIAVTDERKKNYSFTRTYFSEELHVLFLKSRRPDVEGKFSGQRIACQIGTTMEMWLRRNAGGCKLQTIDSNVQAVEALRAGHVDAVVVDGFQAKSFRSRDGHLDSEFLARSDSGYAIAFRKNSPLVELVDGALEKMDADGTLSHLKKKWGLQ
jgi:polar amino acid transport system substrate-binding protein